MRRGYHAVVEPGRWQRIERIYDAVLERDEDERDAFLAEACGDDEALRRHQIVLRLRKEDGVWVQAVLEHVLEPATVVAELHRVLRPEGLVYAETPFMQQVHERAYDFSRFTQSGHRWLFRRFSEISAGPVGGAGVALAWSIRYFSRALGAGNKLSRVIVLPFFWIRYLDAFGRGRAAADAASGFFFLGRRAEQAMDPHAMPEYYNRQK